MIQNLPLFILLISVNTVSLALFAADKLKSKTRSWRVPETRLLLLALFGPFGAYAAMLLFKHKTRKTKFRLIPIFIIIQTTLLAYQYIT
jgi:uncharacterized membrane protein YsdA (DUF1294 family)